MTLDQLRTGIDDLDTQLLSLLNQRIRLAVAVGQLKHKSGQEIYSPHREEAVLKRLFASNEGPLTETSIRAIWREVMSAALAVEKKLIIAYLGPEDSGSYRASVNKFGSSLQYEPLPSMAAVFQAIAMCRADYGVVPTEHLTSAGRSHVCDFLVDSDLKICAEICLPSRHMVIGRQAAPPTGQDKTALLFSLHDRIGALEQSLAVFRKHRINIVTIESRRLRGESGPNIFFVEVQGHAEDKPVREGLDALLAQSDTVKVLGSYAEQSV